MNRSLLLGVILLHFFVTQAQHNDNARVNQIYKKNEVKLNAFRSISGAFEVVYERSMNKKSSLGVSIFVPYNQGKLTEDVDVNYFITSYYRRYFGKKYGSGFFLEGFGMLTSIDGKQLMDENGNLTPNEGPDVIDFAPGIGFGGKWVTNNGFVLEGNIGLGRLLFNAKETDHDSVYRLGLSVGYRF